MKSNLSQQKDINLLAELLDNRFKGPFGWRFGLDGVVGLIPGIGDFITNLLSFYIVFKAYKMNYPPGVLLRMCLNILFENVVDMVPIVGNVFDFIWKANLKNINLIRDYESAPQKTNYKSSFMSASVLLSLVVTISFIVFLSIFIAIKMFIWLLNIAQGLWADSFMIN